MPSYVVVGASRGIGLEYVRQLATNKEVTVSAVVRNKARSTHLLDAVGDAKNVHIVEGDVVDYASLQAAAKEVERLGGGAIDYLIHNAARMDMSLFFLGFDDYPTVDALDADLLDAFKVNALGVAHGIKAFLPLLRAGATKTIVCIGTGGGITKFVRDFGMHNSAAYGVSKAAALMIATKYAGVLAPEGFAVVTLTPGLVDTAGTAVDAPRPEDLKQIEEMANLAAEQGLEVKFETPEESVALQLKLIGSLTPKDNGGIFAHNYGRLE